MSVATVVVAATIHLSLIPPMTMISKELFFDFSPHHGLSSRVCLILLLLRCCCRATRRAVSCRTAAGRGCAPGRSWPSWRSPSSCTTWCSTSGGSWRRRTRPSSTPSSTSPRACRSGSSGSPTTKGIAAF